MKMLNANDPNFVAKLAEAIGVKPGEPVRIMTPQFERTDGLTPVVPETALFDKLREAPKETLKALGLQPWGDYGLWLFPGEWFKHIPNGLDVKCIDGEESKWNASTHDNDTRFGALAYGIVPAFEVAK